VIRQYTGLALTANTNDFRDPDLDEMFQELVQSMIRVAAKMMSVYALYFQAYLKQFHQVLHAYQHPESVHVLRVLLTQQALALVWPSS
jgi:hypothetical protein